MVIILVWRAAPANQTRASETREFGGRSPETGLRTPPLGALRALSTGRTIFCWAPDLLYREEGKSSHELFEKGYVNGVFFGVSGFGWVFGPLPCAARPFQTDINYFRKFCAEWQIFTETDLAL